jgi:hypothetical protein
VNETVVTAVALGLVLAVAAVGTVIALVAMVRQIRRRNSSVEDRGRRAIMNLAIDRGRRQVWGAASIGIVAAGSEFGGGSGCAGAGDGGCAGGGGGGGCGGGCGG